MIYRYLQAFCHFLMIRTFNTQSFFFQNITQPNKPLRMKQTMVGIHIQLMLFNNPFLFISLFIIVIVIAPPQKRRKITPTIIKARTSGVLFVVFIIILSLILYVVQAIQAFHKYCRWKVRNIWFSVTVLLLYTNLK